MTTHADLINNEPPSGESARPGASAVATTPGAISDDRNTRALDRQDDTRLELVEEQLVAETRSVQTGVVLIRKQVVTETRTIQVPVRREELVIERRAVERRPADRVEELGLDDFEGSLAGRFRALQEGESIRLPLIEEEVVVQKRPVVYEEVHIGRRATEETQAFSGTVRREELRVGRRGEANVSHLRRGSASGPEADSVTT